MKRTRIELSLMFAAIILLPNAAFAQEDDMSFGEDEVESADTGAGGEDMTFGEDEAESGAAAGAEGEGEAAGNAEADAAADDLLGGDILGDIGGETAGSTAGGEGPAVDDQEVLRRHPVWAVQQVYALRKGRVDLQPSFGFSMNDPYMQHQAVSLGLSYYITEVIAIGASFNWYRWLDKETDLNFEVSRATHQTVPINEYFLGAQLNFTYVPMYGKFALMKNWILHWDVWFIGGGGFIFTKPVPVIDPEYRTFDHEIKFSFNVGIGGRLYLTRFLAIFLELRDYIFPEKLESLVTYSDPDDRANEDNWIDDEYKMTNNVMLQVGVSLFLPFTFDYKLPK